MNLTKSRKNEEEEDTKKAPSFNLWTVMTEPENHQQFQNPQKRNMIRC